MGEDKERGCKNMYCDECLINDSIKVVKFKNYLDIMELCKECITTFHSDDYEIVKCKNCNSEYLRFNVLSNNGIKAELEYECRDCSNTWKEFLILDNK